MIFCSPVAGIHREHRHRNARLLALQQPYFLGFRESQRLAVLAGGRVVGVEARVARTLFELIGALRIDAEQQGFVGVDRADEAAVDLCDAPRFSARCRHREDGGCGALLGVAGAFAAREIHQAGLAADEQCPHLARDDQFVFSRCDLDGDDAGGAFGDHVAAVGRNAVLMEVHRARSGFGRQADHAMPGGGLYPLEWRRCARLAPPNSAPAHPRSAIRPDDTARQIIRMTFPRNHAGRRSVSEYAQF